MAVSMNVDYTRQIYTGLSTDDWGEIEFNAGDVVYIMDQSQCWIFDGSTMQQLPDLGGGGGGGDTPLVKLASGDYTVTATSWSATIPVAPDGRVEIMRYIKDSVTASTSQVYSGFRKMTPPAIDDIGDYLVSTTNLGVYSQYQASGTKVWNGATYNGGNLISYSGTLDSMTQFGIAQQSSALKVQPGTYHWEIWGYAT